MQPRTPPPKYVTELVQYLSFKEDEKNAKEAQKELRDNLDSYVKKYGYEDARGNWFLELPSPVQVGDKFVKVLKAERRTRLIFNEDRAIELAEAKGVKKRLIKTMEYVDQDEIYVLYQEDHFTDEEVDSMFDKDYQWAFQTLAE